MFKAVVSDLDGTLLNAEHKVSDFTRETVELLLKKGIKFWTLIISRLEKI